MHAHLSQELVCAEALPCDSVLDHKVSELVDVTTGFQNGLWSDASAVDFKQAVFDGKVVAPDCTPVILQGAARGSVIVEASNTIVYFETLVKKEATAHHLFECTAIKFCFFGSHFQGFNTSLQILEHSYGSLNLVLGRLVGLEFANGFFLQLQLLVKGL